jgi:hypothetical protein
MMAATYCLRRHGHSEPSHQIQTSQTFVMCPKTAHIQRDRQPFFRAFGLREGSLRRLHIVVYAAGMLI